MLINSVSGKTLIFGVAASHGCPETVHNAKSQVVVAAAVVAAEPVGVTNSMKTSPILLPDSRRSRSGQALIEFMVGIVAVIVLLGGAIQIGRISTERTRAMQQATRSAHQLALFGDDASAYVPPYMVNWMVGNDERRHSTDDRRIVGSGNAVMNAADQIAQSQRLREQGVDHPMTALPDSAAVLASTDFVRGTSASLGIPVLPVIRNYVYRANSLSVDASAFMVWSGGL